MRVTNWRTLESWLVCRSRAFWLWGKGFKPLVAPDLPMSLKVSLKKLKREAAE
jgi:hypothetical protein